MAKKTKIDRFKDFANGQKFKTHSGAEYKYNEFVTQKRGKKVVTNNITHLKSGQTLEIFEFDNVVIINKF